MSADTNESIHSAKSEQEYHSCEEEPKTKIPRVPIIKNNKPSSDSEHEDDHEGRRSRIQDRNNEVELEEPDLNKYDDAVYPEDHH